MSILQSGIEYLVPKGRFEEIRATAPNRATYNIEATRDLVNNVPLLASPFTPVGIAGLSLPYDFAQASKRARDTFFENNPTSFGITDDAEVPIGPSMIDFGSAIAAENPIDSLVERTKGATIGLADRLARSPEFLSNLFFTPALAPEVTEEERKSIERQPSSFRSLSDPEVYGDLEERKNLLEKALDFIPFVGDESLSGILLNALGGAKDKLTGFRDAVGRRLGPAPFGTSQAAFNALTPSQQQSVASIYGQGGIMQGYNPVSAFGRGPVGAIQNRISNILGRKAAQTKASREKVKQLRQALTDLGGSSDDSGSSGGYGGTGGEGPSAVGSSGMLGGGV